MSEQDRYAWDYKHENMVKQALEKIYSKQLKIEKDLENLLKILTGPNSMV